MPAATLQTPRRVRRRKTEALIWSGAQSRAPR